VGCAQESAESNSLFFITVLSSGGSGHGGAIPGLHLWELGMFEVEYINDFFRKSWQSHLPYYVVVNIIVKFGREEVGTWEIQV